MNRNSDLLHWLEAKFPTLAELPDGWHAQLYWWIEDRLEQMFQWAFDGSDAEMQDALDLAYGEELNHYTPRQQVIIERHYLVYQDVDTWRLLPEHAS